MKVVLKKITSTHNNLRTDVVVGDTHETPVVGCSFHMWGEPLETANGENVRIITTTPVKELKQISDKEYAFTTENSAYSLEIKE